MKVRSKLILIVSSFAVTISALLLLITSQSVKNEVESSVQTNFLEQQKSLNQMQNLVYDRLIESALLLAQNPAFKANVALDDESSIDQAIDEFADIIKADVLAVTDNEGTVISSLGDLLTKGTVLVNDNNVKRSLAGEFPEEDNMAPVLWTLSGYIVQTVTIPIATQFDVLGTLTIGTALTDHEAYLLQLSDHYDVHFLHNNKILASTADESVRSKIEQTLPQLGWEKAIGGTHFLDQDNLYISINAIGVSDEVFLVSSTSKDVALSVMDRIFSKFYWIGAAALLLILLGGYFLGNTISRPVTQLTKAFELVKTGDLSARLEIEGNDEFGQLSRSFNDMVIGLRERVKLRTYVGELTRDMVSNEDEGKSRAITATVLFSDLRFFTKYTESNPPAKVVDMLNRWLGFQAIIIKKHKGAIDKFIGDELMALFTGEDGLQRAILCAMEIQERAQQEKLANPTTVGIGIGINVGDMILGNIGIDQRHDYTVIGSHVNLAARLCSAAGLGEILIQKDVLAETRFNYSDDNISFMRFKGFDKQMEIVRLTTEFSRNSNEIA